MAHLVLVKIVVDNNLAAAQIVVIAVDVGILAAEDTFVANSYMMLVTDAVAFAA